MATTTTNYSFTKPAKSDYYDITVYNDTMDTVDATLKLSEEQYEGAVAAASEAATSAANAEVSEATAVDAANSASGYADDAADSATLAESWAIGGTGTRDGEDEDNSKYYAELASDYADAASSSATSASSSASTASTYATAAANSATEASTYATEASTYAEEAASSATEADEYAVLSQSYASGGTGIRDGEDTDNAYYWYTQAHEIALEGVTAESIAYTESTDSETTVQAIIDELVERIDNLEYMLIQNDISAPIADTSEDDDTIFVTGDGEAVLANWSYATTTDINNLESTVESTISEVESTIQSVESTIQSITFDDDEPTDAGVNDIWISDTE